MEKDKKPKKTILKSIKNCLILVLEYNKVYIVINVLVIVVQGLMPITLIVIMQRIINMLQCGEKEVLGVLKYIGIYILMNIFATIISTWYSCYVWL